jgi:hypothetical protein
MAIIARWRMPPESWWGVVPGAQARLGHADPPQHLHGALARRLAVQLLVQEQRFADLPADGHDRVERGHRLLEDHRDVVAADGPHRRRFEGEQVDTVERNGAADDAPGIVDEPHDGERGDAFAATAFADDRQGFAALQHERDAIDRPYHAVAGIEKGLQVGDLQHVVADR